MQQRSRGRVVKAAELKSVGILPRRFESNRIALYAYYVAGIVTDCRYDGTRYEANY